MGRELSSPLGTKLIAAAIATLCSGVIMLGSFGLAVHYAKQGMTNQTEEQSARMRDDNRIAASRTVAARRS
jgi:hypothetical protein